MTGGEVDTAWWCAEADRLNIPVPNGKGYMLTWMDTVAWADILDDDNWQALGEEAQRSVRRNWHG